MGNNNPSDISTTSRKEMVCPHCWTTGLVKSKSYASQFDGSEKKEIIYASSCTNSECRNHDGGRGDPGRVPPEQVKKQYSSVPFAGKATGLLAGNIKMVGVAVAIVLFGLVLMTTGIPFGGEGGSGTAQAGNIEYENISEDDGGFTAVASKGSWTIYESESVESYLVAGEIDGKIMYLNSDGEPKNETSIFSSQDAAESAIFAWRTKHDQNPEEYSEPSKTEDTLLNQTNWNLYEHNGKYIAAAVVEGEVVYLNPKPEIVSEPYLFDTREAARAAVLAFYNQYGDETPDESPITTVERSQLRKALTDYDSDGNLTDGDGASGSDDVLFASSDNPESQNDREITGEISDSNGKPVEGATVHLYSTHRTTTTDSEGQYRFEDVPAGEHHLFVEPPDGTDLVATQNATLHMNETGTLKIKDSSSHVSAFQSGGAVANNRINIQPPTGHPIKMRGEGSRVAAPVVFKNNKNADEVKVTLKGVYTEGTARKQYQGDIYSSAPEIDGNTKPKSQKLTIQGIAATDKVTKMDWADPSGTQIPIKGNTDPGSVSVELEENYTETRKTSSGKLNGSSVQLNNNGNLSPDNVSLSLKTTQKRYGQYTDKVDLSSSDPNKTTVYQASGTETVQIESNYSYNYDNYDTYWSGDDREHHHYEFEDEVRVIIDRASGPNETIYRYHAEKDPDSYDAPYKNYNGWYYGIDDGGWSNSTVDLQSGDKVIIEAKRSSPDDWIIGNHVKLKSSVYQLKSPESVSVKGAGNGYNTKKVGSGDTVTITDSEIKTEPGMDEIQVSADNLNIEYQLNYTERAGTAGAAVSVDGRNYCRVPNGLTETTSCDIPTQGMKGNELQISSAEGSVPYTVEYTKRVVPEQATVTINGKKYQYPHDFNSEGPLGNSGQSLTIDSLQAGENDLSVSTGTVGGIQPELKTVIRHSSKPKQTNNPTIHVVSASGDVNSKQLPDSALVNGQLVKNETVTLPEDWFSEGRNVIVVQTADTSQVSVEVQSEGLQGQSVEFKPESEVPKQANIPNKRSQTQPPREKSGT